MLATYNEAESTALYHYCRGIMTQTPFIGGFENLARLFALNRNSYDSLKMQLQRENSSFAVSAASNQNRAKKIENLKFKFFLTSFVRLHSYFFAWTIRMHLDYLKTADEGLSQDSVESSTLLLQMNDLLSKSVLKDKAEVINFTELQEMTMAVLEEFDDLILSQKLTDLHLLRLTAVSMFSVHFAELPSIGVFSDANFTTFLQQSSHSSHSVLENMGKNEPKYRSMIQSLCLTSLYGLIARAALKVANNDAGEKHHRKGFLDKALPMLSIFSEWIGQHPALLLNSEEVPSKQPSEGQEDEEEDVIPPAVFADFQKETSTMEKWRSKYCSNKDHVRIEARARSNMKSALSMLKDCWEKDSHIATAPPAVDNDTVTLLLRENAELRGYLPMSELLENYFKDFDPLRKSITWMNDAIARSSRRRTVVQFVKEQLTTVAVVSSNKGDSVLFNPDQQSVKETGPPKGALWSSKEPIKPISLPLEQQQKLKEIKNKHNSENTKGDKSSKKLNDQKDKKKKSKEERLTSEKEDTDRKDKKENKKEKKIAVSAIEEFPSLPGSKPPKELPTSSVTDDFWKNLQVNLAPNDEEEGKVENEEPVPDISESAAFPEGSAFFQAPLSVNNSSSNLNDLDNALSGYGRVGEDIFNDDFEDVVFRPAFPRFHDHTPSPLFGNNSSSNLLNTGNNNGGGQAGFSLADNSNFHNSVLGPDFEDQPNNPSSLFQNDLLTSLGISGAANQPNLSGRSQLSELGSHSSSKDVWDKLGVSSPIDAVSLCVPFLSNFFSPFPVFF
jgi:hypothetical protein